jgi:L-lactate utilization protein LutC
VNLERELKDADMDRDAFLQGVRHAVAEGNRAGTVPPLPVRGTVGYQGGGADPVQRFGEALRAAGGFFHHVHDAGQAADSVLELVASKSARTVLLGKGVALDALGLDERLRQRQVHIINAGQAVTGDWREAYFSADVGISTVAYLIAETGTVVMASQEPRSVSLLPPVHIAVAERRQLLPDLFDLYKEVGAMPSGLTLITGPSKTGDIELKLVTGVHGPGEIHVVLIDH